MEYIDKRWFIVQKYNNQAMDVEQEVKKQLLTLRQFQNYLAESSANIKDFAKIIDIYRNPINRIVKLNCYPLLKTFPSHELVQLELEKDFNNADLEIQLCSLKLAYCLPINALMQIVKLHDSVIYQIIEGSCEFHFERLSAVSSILKLLLTRETEVDPIDMPKQSINNIYTRMAENCFNNNRDISANCILCLSDFLQSRLQNQNNLSYITYNSSQIKAYLLPRIQMLKDKVFSYEVRIRGKLIFLLAILLEGGTQKISVVSTLNPQSIQETQELDVRDFATSLIQQVINLILKPAVEQEILINYSNFLVKMVQMDKFQNYFVRNSIIWQFFDCLNSFIRKQGYKKEMMTVLLPILRFGMDQNTTIAVSMRVLEISTQIQNKLTRILFMIYAFDNLVKCSIELINQKKGSAIMGLYNQAWFLSQLKDEPEELICCMVIATIHNLKNKQLMVEVMDICNQQIWDGCNMEAIIMYLLLVEECTNIIPPNELNLADLINRLNTNQVGFMQKVQILLILTRKFNYQTLSSELNYTQILTELRTYLIQPLGSPITQIDLIQKIYIILYHLFKNFYSSSNKLKQQILEILSDYNDNLMMRKNNKVAECILEFNRYFVKLVQHNEKVEVDQLQIHVEAPSNSMIQTMHFNFFQIGYNIFQAGEITHELESLVANLQALQKTQRNIFTELQTRAKLITGVSDFVQIYCAHVIDLAHSQICLGINVINCCPFLLNNLGVKILLDRNASIQNNIKLIEELPSYQQQQLFFVVKVNPRDSMNFAFDIILEGQCQIRAQTYRISLLEFLIPNYYLHLSISSLNYIHYEQSIQMNCMLEGSYLTLTKKLKDKRMALAFHDLNNPQVFTHSISQNLDQLSQVVSQNIKICLLAYQLDGNILVLSISNIQTNADKCKILVEAKSNSQCIESFRRDVDKLLYELSDGMITKLIE